LPRSTYFSNRETLNSGTYRRNKDDIPVDSFGHLVTVLIHQVLFGGVPWNAEVVPGAIVGFDHHYGAAPFEEALGALERGKFPTLHVELKEIDRKVFRHDSIERNKKPVRAKFVRYWVTIACANILATAPDGDPAVFVAEAGAVAPDRRCLAEIVVQERTEVRVRLKRAYVGEAKPCSKVPRPDTCGTAGLDRDAALLAV
jgi:hypothetical protein